MNNKAEFNIGAIIALVILLAMVFFSIPFIKSEIEGAHNAYYCEDKPYTIQSADLKLCSNVSDYSCLNANYPILNNSALYCMNTTGQHVSADRGFNLYNESATYYGPSVAEYGLLSLISLVIVIGAVLLAYMGLGFGKKD